MSREEQIEKTKRKPIIQCTITGEFVDVFKSMLSAERVTKISRVQIRAVLLNKAPFDRKGFTWLYLDEGSERLIPEPYKKKVEKIKKELNINYKQQTENDQ